MRWNSGLPNAVASTSVELADASLGHN
jgi:hypothetical protein